MFVPANGLWDIDGPQLDRLLKATKSVMNAVEYPRVPGLTGSPVAIFNWRRRPAEASLQAEDVEACRFVERAAEAVGAVVLNLNPAADDSPVSAFALALPYLRELDRGALSAVALRVSAPSFLASAIRAAHLTWPSARVLNCGVRGFEDPLQAVAWLSAVSRLADGIPSTIVVAGPIEGCAATRSTISAFLALGVTVHFIGPRTGVPQHFVDRIEFLSPISSTAPPAALLWIPTPSPDARLDRASASGLKTFISRGFRPRVLAGPGVDSLDNVQLVAPIVVSLSLGDRISSCIAALADS